MPAAAERPAVYEVPHFHRLSDWLGEWAMEPRALAALKELVARLDWEEHLAHVAAAAPQRPSSSVHLEPVKGGKSIAKIPVVGTMTKGSSSLGGTSTISVRRDIRSAAQDKEVAGILLMVDSPGGTVSGIYELAREVKAARSGAGGKPVYVWAEDLCCSAAYWMAAQADMIYAANPLTEVGSIGVYQVVTDYSEALKREGRKAHLLSTGPKKGIGAFGAPVTEDHLAYLQGKVNEVMGHFQQAVKSGRGMSAAQLAAVSDGGTWSGAEAIDKRLIDGIKTQDQAVAALAAAI